ncbi:MAG TPA: MFS transporter [Povalibacter sp.]|uniref:spinster family MFS transporter n=1 Tax=Povalibacter sp. TaxID=1962978 RepID=UPI002CE99C0F|nr:MFS transporter [Povalibacter sp.]HMN45520.1 MFS transporter [Povalibacter sp.]
MDRQILAILIEPIQRDLNLGDGQAGLLYGLAFAVFYSVLGIPIARWADRSDRTRIIVGSTALFSVMTVACGMATGFVPLLLARIGVAIGEAGTGPPSHAIIADLYPVERRSTAMSVFSLGPHIGIVLGLVLGGLSAQWLGWREAFLLAGAISFVVALLALGALKDSPQRNVQSDPVRRIPAAAIVGQLWRYRSIRHVTVGSTVASIAVSALMGWLPTFLMRSHHFSPADAGLLLALVLGVLGGMGTVASGLIADRAGQRDGRARLGSVAAGMLLSAPCWGIAFASDDFGIAILGLASGGALIAFHLGPTFAMVQSLVVREGRALAAALLLFVANLVGVSIGPLLVGAVSDQLAMTHHDESLRVALLGVLPLYLWAAYHYHVAARTLENDLCLATVADDLSCRPAA